MVSRAAHGVATPMPSNSDPNMFLVACYRSPWLALVPFKGDQVLEVRTRRIRGLQADRTVDTMVAQLASDYAVTGIIIEPESRLEVAAQRAGLHIRLLSLAEAKATLLDDGEGQTHQRLFRHLVRKHPALQRLASILPVTGSVSTTDRRGQVTLIAVALGLAAAQQADRLVEGQPLHS